MPYPARNRLLWGTKKADLFRASFSQDLATLPEALYRNNAPATITPTVGPTEFCGNVDFASDTWWGYESDWSIGLGAANKVAGLATRLLYKFNLLNTNMWYRNIFTLLNYIGGQFWTEHGIVHNSNGTYRECFRGESALTITATAAGAGSIDNVSCQALSFPTCLGDVRTLTQSDYIAQVGCNVVTGTQIGLVFALDDAANPQNYALAYIDGTNIHLVQVVAGVYAAESINVAQAVTQGAMIGIAKTASSVVLTYGGVAVGTPQTLNAALCGNVKVGLFSTYAGNFFTQPFLVQKPNVIPCDVGSLVATDTYNVTELLSDGSFEIGGVWDSSPGDGSVDVETVFVHGGGKAAKLTSGASTNTEQRHYNVPVIPGLIYSLNLWSAGDGVNAGGYYIYDASNSAFIQTPVTTGITALAYSLVSNVFTVPAGCTVVTVEIKGPPVNGGIAYFDSVSVKPVSPLLSVTNGALADKGSQLAAADGTPGVWSNTAHARVSGRALKATITQADATLISEFGWDANQAGLLDTGFRFASDTLLPRVNGTLGPTVAVPADAVSIDTLTILQTTGALFLYRVGQVGPFTLLWRGNAGTTTPLFVGLGGRTAALTAKNVIVRDLPLSDWSLCQARVAVPGAITPTLGAELVANGNMEAGDPPTGWTPTTATLDGVADERTGGAGAQSLSIAINGAQYAYVIQALTVAAGAWVRCSAWMRNVDCDNYVYASFNDGSVDIALLPTEGGTTWVNRLRVERITGATPSFGLLIRDVSVTNGRSGRFDDVSVQALSFPSTLGTPQTIGTPDFLAEVSPTLTSGTQAGLAICVNDMAAPTDFCLCYHDGTALHLVKCVGGTYAAESISTACAYVAGARIVVVKDNTTFSCFYNNVKIGADITISDASIIGNKTHACFSTFASNTFSELQIWPRYPQLPGGI